MSQSHKMLFLHFSGQTSFFKQNTATFYRKKEKTSLTKCHQQHCRAVAAMGVNEFNLQSLMYYQAAAVLQVLSINATGAFVKAHPLSDPLEFHSDPEPNRIWFWHSGECSLCRIWTFLNLILILTMVLLILHLENSINLPRRFNIVACIASHWITLLVAPEKQ